MDTSSSDPLHGGTLHPLNRDFVWRAPAWAPSFISREGFDQYCADGYVLVRRAISAEVVAAVTAAIDPFEVEAEAFLRTQPQGRFLIAQADAITFTTHVAARSDVLRAFAGSAPFAGLVRDLIGPSVRLYWDQAVYKKPERTREFPWHQDNGYTFVEPQEYLTCWVPLTDTDETSGCPWVVPGVHRLGTLKHWWTETGYRCLEAPAGAVAVPAKAGDIVVFSSLTPHRTGPNVSAAVRKAYILQYAPDGAVAIAEDGTRTVQNDPARQFMVTGTRG
jgi:ectoine hydroxylase-related dioxygenase (phytanoyl-CoA dioxygenase family)